MDAPSPVLAAGAVVWRAVARELDVLLVHRPRYDDWSFPKGKLDPGEHLLAAAVREVAEESGVRSRLGAPLPPQEYAIGDGLRKRVHYWAARPVGDPAVTDFVPNREVDRVVWVPLDEARGRLTYRRDLAVLDAFGTSAYRSEPLLVLRHGQALPRETWTGDDRQRSLAPDGAAQARALIPLLRAYGVRRVLSSDAVRCTATVQPYAAEAGLRVEVDHALAEQAAEPAHLAHRVERLLRTDEPVVVCTHRPVLPPLLDALGVTDPALPPGGFVVVHRLGMRRYATELHRP